jgi:Mn-dependent DtxR family transcriptional regulator
VTPEERDRRFLLEIARHSHSVRVDQAKSLDAFRRLEDIGWAVNGTPGVFTLTDAGSRTAEKLRTQRRIKG